MSTLLPACCDQTTQTRFDESTPTCGMKLSPLVPGTHCKLPHLPSLKWRMTTSSRSPTKLSQATQAEPSGADAIAGQSSCRNWWPTAVAVISAHNGVIEAIRAAARNRGGIIGLSLYCRRRDPPATEWN